MQSCYSKLSFGWASVDVQRVGKTVQFGSQSVNSRDICILTYGECTVVFYLCTLGQGSGIDYTLTLAPMEPNLF